jgi:hypothetical protein
MVYVNLSPGSQSGEALLFVCVCVCVCVCEHTFLLGQLDLLHLGEALTRGNETKLWRERSGEEIVSRREG